MPSSLIHNTDNSVLKFPFSNSLGGITSKYEAIGGSKRRRTMRSKKSKRSKKTKTKGRGRKL